MTSKPLADQICIVSQSEFIKELTSSADEQEELTGKRRPLVFDQEAVQDHASQKKLIVGRAFSESGESVIFKNKCYQAGFEEVSSFTSPAPSEIGVEVTRASTLGSLKSEDRQFQNLLSNQFELHKVIIKHFLWETISNEKFNLMRFKILPSNCQKLILLFLRVNFGFDLGKSIAKASHKKHLFDIEGSPHFTVGDSSVSLSFVTECYLYGLRKQLKSSGQPSDSRTAIRLLHQALFPGSDSVHHQTFQQTLERILAYDTAPADAGLTSALSIPLLTKMNQIPKHTLAKFFEVKLRNHLSSAIDCAKTPAELKLNLGQRQKTIDILSSYIKADKPASRLYRISVLHITKLI